MMKASLLILIGLVILVLVYLRISNPAGFAKVQTDFAALLTSQPVPADVPVATPHPKPKPMLTSKPATSTPVNLVTKQPKPVHVSEPASSTPIQVATKSETPAPAPAPVLPSSAPVQFTAKPAATAPAPTAPASNILPTAAATEPASLIQPSSPAASEPASLISQTPSPSGESAPSPQQEPASSAPAAPWTPPAVLPSHPHWDWTTTDGQSYKNVKVLKVEPDNVTILHDSGGAHVMLATLTPDLQKMFNYDPDTAAQWVVAKLVEGNLVEFKDGDLQPVNDSTLIPIRYYAIYYSADWCPPCHTFSPKLVKFYNEFKPTHPNFQLVFISEDRNPKAMLGYMKEMAMPWPAVGYDNLLHAPTGTFKGPGIEAYAGPAIPDLVLVDATGRVLADSYQKDRYVGPESVIDDIKAMVR
jgi:nucleoredoxin